MARPRSRYPTELELAILHVLWEQGPQGGREIRQALAPSRRLAYTSVMTMLNIMTDKGHLSRAYQDGRYVYRTRIGRKATTRRMLRDLVERAFDGSAVSLMLNLLETTDVDAGELKQLRQLINRKAKEQSE